MQRGQILHIYVSDSNLLAGILSLYIYMNFITESKKEKPSHPPCE